ncbi:carbohydrate ABC transporter permease [Algisphaera agarilytica]|uniref:sn-glycerol-3-phosphate transport system permease protein UgpE n=1 Tax=Algisphaera agarilytica TaxID=1385975 RepID=A0A7X0H3B1_9BACT|nr:carbohydrate ABC transporter permease [Algisphaera agarilytica]MBB6428513.1 ABC-type glycerol-3-phosphate transport system permease component [Algisphaera agarilytica]
MPRTGVQLFRFVVLTIGSLIFMVPLLWMISTALKPIDQTMSMPPKWTPKQWTATVDGETLEIGLGKVPEDATDQTPVPVTAAFQWGVEREGQRIPVRMRRDDAEADTVTVEMSHHWEWTREGKTNPVRRLDHDSENAASAEGQVLVAVIDEDGGLRRQTVPEAELVKIYGTTHDAVNRSYSDSVTLTLPREQVTRAYVRWNQRQEHAYVKTQTLELPYGDIHESVVPQWGNFAGSIKEMGQFGRYLRNTLVLCFLTVLGTVCSCSVVAYGFSRIEWPGRDKIFYVVLGTMMIPFPVIMVPLYGVFRDLGWIGTLKPLWVPTFFAGAFNVFLLRQFFRTIPKELSEAARIDGCSEFRIFLQVILPLCKPAITVVALFQFLGTWNDFLGPLIYLTDQKDYTLALGLQFFQSQQGGTQWHYLMAASTLVVAPIIILFFMAQRMFIEGISMSGLKG